MIKMIVSDLDGTLLTEKNDVIKEDIQALSKVLNNNVDFSIATGRMDVEILEVLELVKQKAHRISQNGGFVYSKEGKRLFGHVFTPDLAKSIYESLPKTKDSLVTIYSEDKAIVKEHSDMITELADRLFFPIEIEPKLLDKVGNHIETSKITVGGETSYLKALEQKVRETYGNQVDTFISDPNCLDIMPKNISKGRSVKALIDSLQIKPNEIACIGDSFNDLSMFALTSHSYAMSHAESEVKKHATHVVDHVHDMIEHLIQENLI